MPEMLKSASPAFVPPPDDAERRRALDPGQSFLVQAPAGSGKTYLLTQRFLRLLAGAQKPDEIVAITFTIAAAAEMRNRILGALEAAEHLPAGQNDGDPLSVTSLARQALARSRALGWQLLEQPGQLRITTIDAFCRGLALQNPLSWGALTGLGGTLDTAENPDELYRRAARRMLERVNGSSPARHSVEALLLWRDNNWKDVEALIVSMLKQRNRWHQEFVLAREVDWEALRRQLEAPFCRACHKRLFELSALLDGAPQLRDRVLELARGACGAPGPSSPFSLAERAELPVIVADAEAHVAEELEDAASAMRDIAGFLMTREGKWRQKFDKNMGFPSGNAGKELKQAALELLNSLAEIERLEETLSGLREPMPTAYTEREWEIVRHSFLVLREAAAELQVVFAETGVVDFVEVAQIALRVLAPVDGYPSDFALRQADQIRHLLIDEFQDTSRRQHALLASLVAAWPDRDGRSCFCVGDPMQSIYGFRDAEVELFERLRSHGLDLAGETEPFRFEFVALRANFRTAPSLVEDLNRHFRRIFPEHSPSGEVRFSPAQPVRPAGAAAEAELHLAYALAKLPGDGIAAAFGDPQEARQALRQQMVALIQDRLRKAEPLRGTGTKYRIAVLGRKRENLVRVAEALDAASIAYRAIELVPLRDRAEILDALAVARAWMNPADRRAWLGVLRAPWCGLSLDELHRLVSSDDPAITEMAVPDLLRDRLEELWSTGQISPAGYNAAVRVRQTMREAAERRPEAALFALGTWLESLWRSLGGEAVSNAEERANLRLLWAALDKLPGGDVDLTGTALEGALDGMYAQPDPTADSDFGVLLMTIHKSKGLEFEVVIVPDLDMSGKQGERSLISWLERGLPDGAFGSELTEFLIAPIPARGTKAGPAKNFVDGVKRGRERSEMRRLLYVAATRAREELHLFARPGFREDKSGLPVLLKPSEAALLAAAWPAFAETIEARFQDWLGAIPEPMEASLYEIAAAESAEQPKAMQNLLVMRPPLQATGMRRLTEKFVAPAMLRGSRGTGSRQAGLPAGRPEQAYERASGGLEVRLEGTAIHAYLEELSRLRQSWDEAEAARRLEGMGGMVAAELRGRGLSPTEAEAMSARALKIVRGILSHPAGAWVVAPHAEAAVEARWTGLLPGAGGGTSALRTLRPDRVFFAAPHTGESGPSWWIVDYKTSHRDFRAGLASGSGAAESEEAQMRFMEEHRRLHAGQLESYASLLRGLQGDAVEIRAGIYYPRLLLFDHWRVL